MINVRRGCWLRSGYGDWANRRPRGAAHLQRQADEAELIDLCGGELLEVEVLDDRDPGSDQEKDMAGQSHTKLRIGGPDDVPGDVVGADGLDFALHKPARACPANSRSFQILIGLAPERAITSAHK